MSDVTPLLTIMDQAYNRPSWHGTNLRGSVRRVTPAQAAWRPGPGRHNIWETVVHAAYWKYAASRRFIDQPQGWLGGTVKVDWPILTNIRLDPFERTGMPGGANGSMHYYEWFVYQFWRFVFVQQEVAKAAQTFIDFPPMQKGASFNMAAVKAQIEAVIAANRHSE